MHSRGGASCSSFSYRLDVYLHSRQEGLEYMYQVLNSREAKLEILWYDGSDFGVALIDCGAVTFACLSYLPVILSTVAEETRL